MSGLLGTIAIAAQLVGLVAIYWMCFEFFTLPAELMQQFTADAEAVRQYLVETFASWQPWPIVGIVGAVLGASLILNGRCRDAWFLATSRVLAWLWLPLVPVGTLVGALVLIARSRAARRAAPDARAPSR